MLSFQIIRQYGAVQISCDDDGIDKLVAALRALRGSGSHVHLYAPSMGGNVLDDRGPFDEASVPEVIITHGGDPKPDIG
jgi:hypothetical protein